MKLTLRLWLHLLFFSSFILPSFAFLSACRATPTPPPAIHFRIGTADSTQYIARESANAYRRAHPTTTFDFFTGNSTTALRELSFDQFDFAFIERNPRADELERAGATALELGRDGVFIIVHPSNPLRNLSRQDLKEIMTGELNLWSQLGIAVPGGPDEIQVLTREEGSGMRAVIEDQVMQGARLTLTALLQPTNLDMLDYVADHPGAIGYVAANVWNDNSRTRALSLDNVIASRATIHAGTYPLLQTVFLIVPQTATLNGKKRIQSPENITSFLEFLSGSDGRAVLYQRIVELPPK